MGSCVSHAQCRYTPAPKPKGGIVNFHIKVANTVFARWNKWIVSEYANDGLNMSINFHKVVFVHIAIYRRRFFLAAARSCFFPVLPPPSSDHPPGGTRFGWHKVEDFRRSKQKKNSNIKRSWDAHSHEWNMFNRCSVRGRSPPKGKHRTAANPTLPPLRNHPAD